jgi:probable addiction module antidote protein
MIETRPYDSAEFLDTDHLRALYLTEALSTGDPAFIADAIDTIARARRLHGAPQDAAGVGSTDRTLGDRPDPEFGAVLDAIRSLGLRLEATVAQPETAES